MYMYIYTSTCTCTPPRVHVHAHTCTCTHVYMYTHTPVHVYTSYLLPRFCTVLEFVTGNDLDFLLKQNKTIPEKEVDPLI